MGEIADAEVICIDFCLIQEQRQLVRLSKCVKRKRVERRGGKKGIFHLLLLCWGKSEGKREAGATTRLGFVTRDFHFSLVRKER